MDEERSRGTAAKRVRKAFRSRTKRNPKLNVLRLQSEKRYVKIEGKRQLITVLVLRNQNGILSEVAKTPSEQAELREWYREYNRITKTENLPASKELREKLTTATDGLEARGFAYRHMWYGTARNKKTGKQRYKRIEVFKATPWTTEERRNIRNFFYEHIPKSNLGLFVYHQNKLYMHPATATS